MPDWLASLVVLVAAIVAAAIAHFGLFAALARMSDSQRYLKVIERRVRGPALLALILIALQVALEIVPWDNAAATASDALLVGLIVLIGWTVLRSLQIASDLYLRRFSIDVEDNLLARKHHTQVRILRRATATIVIIVTVAAVLMTFEGVRQYGVSLLASAGAAGIILGLALQPLLKNLIAGIQIAISQPIRIEDAVIVEGEWGWIEEITSTYVVVRIWDWRRLVLPLSYFIEHPFQNWTKQDASLIGSVFLYADYTVPVDRVRGKLQEW